METPNETTPNEPDQNDNESTEQGDVSPIDSFLNEISGGVAAEGEEQDHSDDAAHEGGKTVDFDKWWPGQMRIYAGTNVMHFQIGKSTREKAYTPFNAYATPEIAAKYAELESAGQVNQPSLYGSPRYYTPCEVSGDPDNPKRGLLLRLGGERYRFENPSYEYEEKTTAQLIGE